MDDIGNLVYILFIVISIIIGAIRNRKKKQEEGAPASPPPPTAPTSYQSEEDKLREKVREIQRRLEGEIDAMTQNERRAATRSTRNQEPSYTSLEAGPSLESGPALESNKSLEMESQYRSAMERLNKAQKKNAPKKVTQRRKTSPFLKKFSLRDAVIYSEVMDRKYF